MAEANNYGIGSYENFQSCVTSSSSVQFTYYFGVSKNPYKCPSEIDWYKSGVDFDYTEIGENAIEADTNDRVISGNAYNGKDVSALTHELAITIKPSLNSNLWQRLMSIQATDSLEQKNGNYIKAYLNGGFHLLVQVNDGEGSGYVFNKVYTNLTTNTLPDDVFQNWGDSELGTELTFTVNHQPAYELNQVPGGWALNAEGKDLAPTITGTESLAISATALTGTITLVDDSNIAYNKNIQVNVMDSNGNMIASQTIVNPKTKSAVNITGEFNDSNYVVTLGWFLSEATPVNSTRVSLIKS